MNRQDSFPQHSTDVVLDVGNTVSRFFILHLSFSKENPMLIQSWLRSIRTALFGRPTPKARRTPRRMAHVSEALEQRTVLAVSYSLELVRRDALEGAVAPSLNTARFLVHGTPVDSPEAMTGSMGINVLIASTGTSVATPSGSYISDYDYRVFVGDGAMQTEVFPWYNAMLAQYQFSVMGLYGGGSVPVTIEGRQDFVTEGIEHINLQLVTMGVMAGMPGGLDGYNDVLGSVSALDLRVLDSVATVTIGAADDLASEPVAGEPANTGSLTFSRAGGDLTQPLTVNFSTGGTATQGSDYATLPSSVTFPANQESVSITITASTDGETEADETVVATLTSGNGYVLGTTTSATVTIEDVPPYDVARSTVSVATLNGSAEEDNSQGGVKDQIIRISRSLIGEALTVYYSLAGTATNGTDYSSLPTASITIPENDSYIDLTVHPYWDTSVEGTESVTLTLATDPNDEDRYDVSNTDYEANAEILDAALPTITIQAIDPDATEMTNSGHGDNAELQVLVSRPALHSSHPVEVAYSIGGTATSLTDYLPLSGTITIAGDATSGRIVVKPEWDKVQPEEADESVVIDLTAAAGYSLGTATSATAWIHNTEVSIVALTVTDSAAAEEGPNNGDPIPGRFAFHRTGNLAVPVTVYLGFSGAALKDLDFTGVNGFSITLPVGQAETILELTPIWDTLIEGDESVTVFLNSGPHYLVDENQYSGMMTIADAPQPTISVSSASDSLAAEDAGNGGAGPGVWIISRTGGTTQPLTVSYLISGDATALTDYTTNPILNGGASATITFPVGVSAISIQLNPEWNKELESDEVATLTIVDTDDYVLAEGQSTADITITDAPLPDVWVTLSDTEAYEQAVTNSAPVPVTFTIHRTGNTSKALGVNLGFSGTAGANDYSLSLSTANSITIPVGYSSATITLTPTVDFIYTEGIETRTLNLQAGADYQLLSPSEATVNIHDADLPFVTVEFVQAAALEEGGDGNPVPGMIRLHRTGSLASSLIVSHTETYVTGSIQGGSDYEPVIATFPVGVATIDIQLKPIWDDRVEGDEIVKFKLNANNSYQTNAFTDFALITIKDSAVPLVSITTQQDAWEEDSFGNPESGYLRISRWTGSNLRTLSVAYHIDSSSTATLNVDYQGTSYNGVAVIPAGQSYVDVAVVPKQDNNNQEQTEWVDYSLVVSTKYQFVDPSTRVLIEDSPLPRVRVQAIDSNAAEPANGVTDTGTFVVTRVGRLNQSLTVQLEVSGTATVGADFTSNPALSSGSITVTFEAWESSRTITITPVADQQHSEEVESVNLSVAPAAGYAIEAGYEQAIVNLADAPDLMIIEIYAVTHETGESIAPYMNMGDPITFPPGKAVVARSGRTDEAVTVQVHVAGTATFGTDYTSTVSVAGSTISVEFAAGEMLKYIEFTPITDTLVELDETILLSVSETASYHVGEHSADTITIHDNHPTVTVVATDRFATENSMEPGGTYNDNGEFTFTRVGGDLWTPLTVSFVLSGTAMNYMDYWAYTPDGTNLITIPSGQMSAVLTVYPSMDMMPGSFEFMETVILTLSTSSSYAVGTPSSDTILIADAQDPTYIVTAIDPEATEPYSGSAEDSGMFLITRLGGSFLSADTVSFTLGGSAVQNSDYSVSSYLTVTIPANQNGVVVAVIPNADANFAENSETVTLRLSDYFIGDEYVGPPELQLLAQATVTIQPAVNHAPTFETTFDSLYTLVEDANSAMGIDFHVDDQETPAFDLGVTASVVPAGLINVSVITPPAGAGGDRQLQIVPLANQFGTATVTLRVTDANGATETKTLQVKVNSVNDAPSFTAGSDVTINEDSGRQSIPNWATNLSSGPLNESGQSLTFEITGHTIQGATYGSLSELFEELPQISPSGTLTFKSGPNKYGTAVLTVKLKDNGGTENGGINSLTSVNLTILVNPVNDAPSFRHGADVTVKSNSSLKMIEDWATELIAGPPDESWQQFDFIISGGAQIGPTQSGPSTLRPLSDLFSQLPTISPTGTLTFQPAANKYGTAFVVVKLHDNGGTEFGGEDMGVAVMLTIVVDGNTLTISEDTVDEMQHFTVSGTATGTPGAQGLINVNWGNQTANSIMYGGQFDADGWMNFSFVGQFRDDRPSQTPDQYMIACSVMERPSPESIALPVVTYTFYPRTLTVNNVAPTQNIIPYYWDGRNTDGHNVQLKGSIYDVSPDDHFTMIVDWGDGQLETVHLDRGLVDLEGTAPFYSHKYFPGNYLSSVEGDYGFADAKITIQDDDGGATSEQTFRVLIDSAPFDNFSSGGRKYSSLSGSLLFIDAANGLLNQWEDLETDVLTPFVTSQPGHGTITLNSDGSFAYVATVGFSGIDTFEYAVSDGWLQRTATVSIAVSTIQLHSIDFIGPGSIAIQSDPNLDNGESISYSFQEWLDNNNDGIINLAQGDRQYPAGYVSGSQIILAPEFNVISATSSANYPALSILVRATGPDGLGTNPTALGSPLAFTEVLPAHTVKYEQAFVITWQVTTDGGSHWSTVATSQNAMYLTYDVQTSTSPIYESIIYLSTMNASGNTSPKDIVEDIYADFMDLDVRSVDGAQLSYWGPTSMGRTLEWLQANRSTVDLSTVSAGGMNPDGTHDNLEVTQVKGLLRFADGQCGAWQKFLMELLKVQGLSPTGIMILPDANPTSNTNAHFGFLVKNWTFTGSGFWASQGVTDGYDYSMQEILDPTTGATLVPRDAIDSPQGVAGQGNSNPPGGFFNHFIVRWDYLDAQGVRHSWYLDPSYGLDIFSSLGEWENAALSGTFVTFGPNGQLGFPERAKKNVVGLLEVKEVQIP